MSTESCLLKIGLDRFLELDGQNGQSSNFRHDHEIQPEKLGVRDCGAFGAMGFLEKLLVGLGQKKDKSTSGLIQQRSFVITITCW
jgi:hypothetical protein